ncbi:MAG: LemA family protein [Bacteroidetes bacterium]|nr:LemA family protein [Bacteroidota bacterium]
MKGKKYWIYGIGILLIIIGILFITTYNRLVGKEENVNRTWSEVQNNYQRRIDLIPNLVNVVKGLSDFEQSTLEEIAAARAKASGATLNNTSATLQNIETIQNTQNELATATNKLIIAIEKYPTLKGTTAYLGLQRQLEGTERRIKTERVRFNEAVADYNIAFRSFPSNVFAKLLGFSSKEGFEAVAGADKAVLIEFKQ